jgi:tetratricopeptide (TPR) repeat protein
LGDDAATRFYQLARPAESDIASAELSARGVELMGWAKEDASYWLGLIAYERGSHAAAVDFFLKRTLEAFPDGRWTDGARYNLARTYEAMNRFDEAITLYESDASLQRHGNLLRARRLKSTSQANNSGR